MIAGGTRLPCAEGVIRAGAAHAPCAPRAGPWVLAATILGSNMVFIDGTAVNVALPALQANVGATAAGVQGSEFEAGRDRMYKPIPPIRERPRHSDSVASRSAIGPSSNGCRRCICWP